MVIRPRKDMIKSLGRKVQACQLRCVLIDGFACNLVFRSAMRSADQAG